MPSLAIARQVIELHQFLDDRVLAAAFDAFGHTAVQVPLQQQRLQFLDGLADGVGLAEDIHAILVLFDHLANAAEMALDIVQPLDHLSLFSTHRSLLLKSPTPWVGVYLNRTSC